MADVIGILRGDSDASHPMGRFVALEFKSENGRQTPEQVAFERMLVKFGGLYAVCHSPEDAGSAIERWLS
jgi:hypothetical protein